MFMPQQPGDNSQIFPSLPVMDSQRKQVSCFASLGVESSLSILNFSILALRTIRSKIGRTLRLNTNNMEKMV
jgi:hypothetical protein